MIMLPIKSILAIYALFINALAWDLLPRDGTTGTDAINFLRCINNNGFPNDTRVGVDLNHFLVILRGKNSSPFAENSVMMCLNDYGHKIQVDQYFSDDFEEGTNDLGTIEEATRAIYPIDGITRLISIDYMDDVGAMSFDKFIN